MNSNFTSQPSPYQRLYKSRKPKGAPDTYVMSAEELRNVDLNAPSPYQRMQRAMNTDNMFGSRALPIQTPFTTGRENPFTTGREPQTPFTTSEMENLMRLDAYLENGERSNKGGKKHRSRKTKRRNRKSMRRRK